MEFAMQNCPVEGILSTSDGGSVTFDDLQAILERLKALEGQPGRMQELEGEQILQLEALTEYTYENCPVERAGTFHDGRQVSAKDIGTLRAKLKDCRLEPAQTI